MKKIDKGVDLLDFNFNKNLMENKFEGRSIGPKSIKKLIIESKIEVPSYENMEIQQIGSNKRVRIDEEDENFMDCYEEMPISLEKLEQPLYSFEALKEIEMNHLKKEIDSVKRNKNNKSDVYELLIDKLFNILSDIKTNRKMVSFKLKNQDKENIVKKYSEAAQKRNESKTNKSKAKFISIFPAENRVEEIQQYLNGNQAPAKIYKKLPILERMIKPEFEIFKGPLKDKIDSFQIVYFSGIKQRRIGVLRSLIYSYSKVKKYSIKQIEFINRDTVEILVDSQETKEILIEFFTKNMEGGAGNYIKHLPYFNALESIGGSEIATEAIFIARAARICCYTKDLAVATCSKIIKKN